jgi:hypothetical protein
MTDQNSNTPSSPSTPEVGSEKTILSPDALHEQKASAPSSATPPRSADDQRLDAIQSEIALLEKYAAEAETGRQRRDFLAKRDALVNERTELTLKDIKSQPAWGDEPPTQPEQNVDPETDGWAIEVPGNIDQARRADAQAYAEDMGVATRLAGIPQGEAQVLFEFVSTLATGQLEGLNTANEQEVQSHMANVYGSTTADAIIGAAVRAYKALPRDVQVWLDKPNDAGERLPNSPSVLSMLALYNGGYSKLSKDQAAKELQQIRESKEYQGKPSRLTLDKVLLLNLIATRGDESAVSRNLEMRADADKRARIEKAQKKAGPIQKEIEALQRDPRRLSMDSKVRLPLVNRLEALRRQLHDMGGA